MDSIISKRFHPDSWNIYLFQCSDGDNWPTDNEKVANIVQALKQKCQFIGYCEIEPEDERLKWATEDSSLASTYRFLEDSKCKTSFVKMPSDIWPAFKAFFGGKLVDV